MATTACHHSKRTQGITRAAMPILCFGCVMSRQHDTRSPELQRKAIPTSHTSVHACATISSSRLCCRNVMLWRCQAHVHFRVAVRAPLRRVSFALLGMRV
jgi:hypothetical protein